MKAKTHHAHAIKAGGHAATYAITHVASKHSPSGVGHHNGHKVGGTHHKGGGFPKIHAPKGFVKRGFHGHFGA